MIHVAILNKNYIENEEKEMMNYFKDLLKKKMPGVKLPSIEFEPFLALGIDMNENAHIEMDQLLKKYNIDYIKVIKGKDRLIYLFENRD